MAHDTHFLARVLGVRGAQTDLALGLYRDPELLRFILKQARLPDGASRVALALEPSPEGPYVVVERSGHFVTCLGAGMATDLPVITRPELDCPS
jgi:hypothetical protein